jgi:hypothetical protein
MPVGRLTDLQLRCLVVLAEMDPAWTLGGGGALVGAYFGHRVTRDLDLFWHGRASLGEVTTEARRRLVAAGLSPVVLQSGPNHERLRLTVGGEVLVLDLIAEPISSLELPGSLDLGSVRVAVDTPHELLVNKLCALLERSELRDLEDVQVLLDGGGDLARALRDAPRKDAGFSPLTLAWVLRDLQVRALGEASGYDPEVIDGLSKVREWLVAELVRQAAMPE